MVVPVLFVLADLGHRRVALPGLVQLCPSRNFVCGPVHWGISVPSTQRGSDSCGILSIPGSLHWRLSLLWRRELCVCTCSSIACTADSPCCMYLAE
jgi:hypothetical protein